MASGIYAKGIGKLVDTGINWSDPGSTMKAQLTSSSYTESLDNDDFRDDVSAYQIAGTTDQAIPTKGVTYDAGNDYVYLDCGASITFSSVASGTCHGIVIYKDVGTPATDNLLCWCEFTADVTANGSNIQVNFDTNGVVRFYYGP